ncbi:MAG: aminoacyl-tRNA hydrolase [Candidatus Moraniibacteriota bacterium]|nr:MAG: aminoacyl-tRNA hydrolase [Candidatus Moranbacteria bacterium]
MTTLLVGLGNPGPEYVRTRHNLGFLALDWLRERFDAPAFQPEAKFFADLSSVMQEGNKFILAKPTTFMNESGRSVRAILDYYKLGIDTLIVIHDDLDIAPSTLRTTDSSRAAGHNGVQDIIDTLGTQDFFRIRLGIGRPAEVEGVCPPETLREPGVSVRAGIPSHDYVLGHLSDEEYTKLEALFTEMEKVLRSRLAT